MWNLLKLLILIGIRLTLGIPQLDLVKEESIFYLIPLSILW